MALQLAIMQSQEDPSDIKAKACLQAYTVSQESRSIISLTGSDKTVFVSR